MNVLGVAFPILLGLVIVAVGYRSRQPRRDLVLLLISALVWTLANLISKTPPTDSAVVNAVLLFGPPLAAFILLAKRWSTFPVE